MVESILSLEGDRRVMVDRVGKEGGASYLTICQPIREEGTQHSVINSWYQLSFSTLSANPNLTSHLPLPSLVFCPPTDAPSSPLQPYHLNLLIELN